MEKNSVSFIVKNMTCVNCEKVIYNALIHCKGIFTVSVSYRTQILEIVYDSEETTLSSIVKILSETGYEVSELKAQSDNKKYTLLQFAGMLILVMGAYLLISRVEILDSELKVQSTFGYGMLFVVGLLTSMHCIAMCGGINLSQCIQPLPVKSSQHTYQRSLLYNIGRVISYTIIGALVGGVGSAVSLSGHFKGSISIVAGIMMILMGIKMLHIFPKFSKINIHFPPRLRMIFLGRDEKRGPFVVGLLNGLMPCGPLQTMQIYALGTGSALTGGLSMLAFSLGTVPLMFGFGVLGTLISKKSTQKMMKTSAVIIVILGAVLLQRGFIISGVTIPSIQENVDATDTEIVIENGVQIVTVLVQSRNYPEFVLKNNIPARVNFKVSEQNLNGCNDVVLIPEFDIEKQLSVGDNWIEFTPTQTGSFPFSCWMGMINSQFQVIE